MRGDRWQGSVLESTWVGDLTPGPCQGSAWERRGTRAAQAESDRSLAEWSYGMAIAHASPVASRLS